MLICTSALVSESIFSTDTSMMSFANPEHKSLASISSLWVISCIWSSGVETSSPVSLELLLSDKTLHFCKWRGLGVFYFLVSFGVLFWWFFLHGFFVCFLGLVLVLILLWLLQGSPLWKPDSFLMALRDGTVRRFVISGHFVRAGAFMILVLMCWFEHQLHARQLGAPCHPRISELPDLFCAAVEELPRHGCPRCERHQLGAFWWVVTEQGQLLKHVQIKVLSCDSAPCKWENE